MAPAEVEPPMDRLARGAARGDAEAIALLLDEVGPLLVRYCRARFGRRGDSYRQADELAAEAGRAVLAAVAGYAGGSFLRLVYRVTFRVLDELAPADPVGSGAGADEPGLAELLPMLAPLDRDIVLLRAATGLSAADTAAALGLTTGQVRVAQHRALTKLRAKLGEG